MARPALWLFTLAIIVFFVWASWANLEEITRGVGKVAPLARAQVIQSLEGGILSSLEVHEGDEIGKGDILAVIEDTQFRSSFEEMRTQKIAAEAAITRYQAELAGNEEIVFDEDLLAKPDIVDSESKLFHARRKSFKGARKTLRERLELAKKELDLILPLAAKGAVSAVDQIKLERSVADLSGELIETENKYYEELARELSEKTLELDSVNEKLAQEEDKLRRTVLRSPVRGIVKSMSVTTRGGVIRPGEPIMEIIPLDDQLFVEAKISPKDVAFIHEEMPARVKITAFDYTIYGSLEGVVDNISPDTITDETSRDASPYYLVRIKTKETALNGPDGLMPIKPGMIASVDILTGEKTVLSYLLKPLMRGSESLTER